MRRLVKNSVVLGAALATAAGIAFSAGREQAPAAIEASSHREAPAISNDPAADTTDFYAWVSPDAPDSVTFAVNSWPFCAPYAGPNWCLFGDDVVQRVNIDNDGDAQADIMYEFRFRTEIKDGETFLLNTGPITSLDDTDFNIRQYYSVTRIDAPWIANAMRTTELIKDAPVPPPYVGVKSTPNYEALAQAAIRGLPGGGKVFAGQRDDPFYVDLGATFDLLTIRGGPPGNRGGNPDSLAGFNVNSIVLQVPMANVTGASGPIIGTWATSHRDNGSGEMRQVSRLGQPLVNEVVVPLKLKDAFNTIDPTKDSVALPYVQDPIVGKLFRAIYNLDVPPAPRNDLVTVFLTGIPNLNQPDGVVPSEQLRLNMSIAPSANPNRLGVLGGDTAGFPNGRRLTDDVVDIALQAVAGGTPFTPQFNVAPNNQLGDGVDANDAPFLHAFPYLASPWAGSEYAGTQRITTP